MWPFPLTPLLGFLLFPEPWGGKGGGGRGEGGGRMGAQYNLTLFKNTDYVLRLTDAVTTGAFYLSGNSGWEWNSWKDNRTSRNSSFWRCMTTGLSLLSSLFPCRHACMPSLRWCSKVLWYTPQKFSGDEEEQWAVHYFIVCSPTSVFLLPPPPRLPKKALIHH